MTSYPDENRNYIYNQCPDEKREKDKEVPIGTVIKEFGTASILTSGVYGLAIAASSFLGPIGGLAVLFGSGTYALNTLEDRNNKYYHYNTQDLSKYWSKRETVRQKQIHKQVNKNYYDKTLIFGWTPYVINASEYFIWPKKVPKEKDINTCRLRHAIKMIRISQLDFEPEPWRIPKVKKKYVPIYDDGFSQSRYNGGRYVRHQEEVVDVTLSNDNTVKFESSQFQDKPLLKEYWEIEIIKLKKLIALSEHMKKLKNSN